MSKDTTLFPISFYLTRILILLKISYFTFIILSLYSSKIPNKLNILIIKPILKNQEKMSDDLNNIRPISISTCLAQIFEILIHIKSPRLNSTHKNQFGFKHKISCNHAIFTLKETILN